MPPDLQELAEDGWHDAADEQFASIFGHFAASTPSDAAALLAGTSATWWIAGGHALEAAGRPAREHADLDVAVLRSDLDAVVAHLADLHLWEPQGLGLRLQVPGEPVPEGCDQLWVRRDASSPWLLDLLSTPAEGEDWLFLRDPRVRRPLSQVGVVVEGIPHLRPEVVLLHKAPLDRAKDRDDLAATLPHLDPAAVAWLDDALTVVAPDHPWRRLLPRKQ